MPGRGRGRGSRTTGQPVQSLLPRMLPNLHYHPLTTFGRTVVLAHAHVLVGREPCFAGVADLHGRAWDWEDGQRQRQEGQAGLE